MILNADFKDFKYKSDSDLVWTIQSIYKKNRKYPLLRYKIHDHNLTIIGLWKTSIL